MSTLLQNKLWVEKYRPSSVSDYIFHNDKQKLKFLKMIASQSIPNLLLSGVQGTGKTTIARILISELNIDQNIDVLHINASDLNSVDTVRTRIKEHIQSFPVGDFKVVHLEEADYLTLNAQAVLRGFMEDYTDDVRFILTCNYRHKLIPAIRSRCQEFEFKAPDVETITARMEHILQKEGVSEYSELHKYVAIGYPDIRKIIQLLQENVSGSNLLTPNSCSGADDYKLKLLDLMVASKWDEIRSLLCSEVSSEEWEDVYKFIYDNIHTCPQFSNNSKYEQAVITIADYLYKHQAVADPEINAAALIITLKHI